MFAFPGKKGNCEFNFCVCMWLYVVCKWLTHLLRSFKCDCGKNSQFAIIRLSHLKSVLRYTVVSAVDHVVLHEHRLLTQYLRSLGHPAQGLPPVWYGFSPSKLPLKLRKYNKDRDATSIYNI